MQFERQPQRGSRLIALSTAKEVRFMTLDLETLILRKTRLDKADVAKDLGISRMSFWRMCKGLQYFTPWLALKASALYNIPLRTVLMAAGYSDKEAEDVCSCVFKCAAIGEKESKETLAS